MNRVKIATGLRRMAVGHALVLMYAGVAVAGAARTSHNTRSRASATSALRTARS